MFLCDSGRFGRLSWRNAVWVIVIAVSATALSVVAVGCKQSKTGSVLEGTPTGASQPTPPSSTQAVVSPKVETKFLCKGRNKDNSIEDRYSVDFDAKTVARADEVTGRLNFEPDNSTVSITEDSITFTQSVDLGQIVSQQHVVINRKGGAYTINGEKSGKCVVVQKFGPSVRF